MKVLIFSVAYFPFVGGAEIAVKEITDRISNVEFHLITVNLDGKQKKTEKIGNVFVYRVSRGYLGKLFFPFVGAWKGLALQRAQKFDAIWAIMANYAGFAALFFKYFQPKVPFILTLQEGDPIDYIKRQVRFVYPFFVQIFRRANRVQTISNYLADFAKSMGTTAPINVIPNGVDGELFGREYPASEIEKIKSRIGRMRGDIFLVTASRLVVKNGIEDVLRALVFLPENVKFLVIGSGPLESRLKKIAADLSLKNRVVFQGFVAHADLPKYFKASDIFIRPSLSEGLGSAFLEVMAAGLPVIATPVGGIPDFLKDGETGVFCQVNNPKNIAEKVRQIISNENLRNRIVQNARQMVAEKYDWNLIAKRMGDEIIKKHG